jgi:hypothetical protein
MRIWVILVVLVSPLCTAGDFGEASLYPATLYWFSDTTGDLHRTRIHSERGDPITRTLFRAVDHGMSASQGFRGRSIVMDEPRCKILWTVETKMPAPRTRLYRANVDGSNLETLVDVPVVISGITIDYDSQFLYWMESTEGLGVDRLMRMALSGAGSEVVFSSIELGGFSGLDGMGLWEVTGISPYEYSLPSLTPRVIFLARDYIGETGNSHILHYLPEEGIIEVLADFPESHSIADGFIRHAPTIQSVPWSGFYYFTHSKDQFVNEFVSPPSLINTDNLISDFLLVPRLSTLFFNLISPEENQSLISQFSLVTDVSAQALFVDERIGTMTVDLRPTLRHDTPFLEEEHDQFLVTTGLSDDLDDDGLPDLASLLLIEGIMNVYKQYDSEIGHLARHYHGTLDVMQTELGLVEPPISREITVALFLIDQPFIDRIRQYYSEKGINLSEFYTPFAGEFGFNRGSEMPPFTGRGDIDEDGFTNLEEYLAVFERGGTIRDFVEAALDASTNGEGGAFPAFPPGAGGGGGGGGNCLIASAAEGTAFENELDSIRSIRDTVLLTNPVGSAIAEAYYRISAWWLEE